MHQYHVNRIRKHKLGRFLTKQETVTLSLLWEGKTNKEIAAAMFITERTVKFHMSSLLVKYNCVNRIQLILKTQGERNENGVIRYIGSTQNAHQRTA